MRILPMLWLCIFVYSYTTTAQESQSPAAIIQTFLEENRLDLGLQSTDIQNWTITNHHKSQQSGATYVYIQQTHNGIGVENGVANFAIKDNKVLSMGNRLISNLAQKANYTTPTINPKKAIVAAAEQLQLNAPKGLKTIDVLDDKHFIFNKGNLSLENIPVKLMYFAANEQTLQLVWDLSIYQQDAQHWWSVRIDAQNGQLIDQKDWVTHCTFEHEPFVNCSSPKHQTSTTNYASPNQLAAPDQYTVFALPLESPNHGSRSVVTNPSDSISSPFGWHDTNGAAGAEYTITRGNNVHAYEDTLDDNSPGFSPDGGAVLEFNFPYNGFASPTTYLPAAITNLFYTNNIMHDIWYRYGFDEASGNFQANNYGNGGQGGDYVRAEAQDGSGTNNANFATPNDGNRPRMQMYIWPFNSNTGHFLKVHSPNNIASSYFAIKSNFGPPPPPVPITADLAVLEDAVAPTNDGCDSITNAALLSGKIVLIDQGTCGFTQKVRAAQDAGAVAVVMVSTLGFLFPPSGTDPTITIPTIMILPAVANAIKAELALGNTVNGSLDNDGVSDKDSDLDNGIIAHEYGHGISNRLTGGGSNSNCLRNAEQMGEGWSDWFGLMITIEPGDAGEDVRGIGTYVQNEAPTGPGIRPAPYSTDFAVNNYTYGHSNNSSSISRPHGVGFIYATALWDLTWALIDHYGGTPDPDLYNGTGGNNVAMKLVIESLKLQPCSPGMIDGRDAMLQADQILYNGAHECIIWEAFAKRGFGYSASQGSTNSRTDQVEAFDLSPVCLTATAPPVAGFSNNNINSCISTIQFTDSSSSTPHQWFWDFGDGNTSTQQSPTHSYMNSGAYTIKLVVTNNMGADSVSQQITITLPPAPIAVDGETCAGDTAILTASGTGTIRWRNLANNIIQTGDTLYASNVASTQTYYAENTTGAAAQFIGPIDTSIGNGAFLSASYHHAINFRAEQALEIVSFWTYANSAGNRTFFLANDYNTTGNAPTSIVDDVNVYLEEGWQEVFVYLTVPDSGFYHLTGANLDLYNNTSGVNYPYAISNFMSINSSSSNTGATDNYPFFYNIKAQEPRCVSVKDTALAIPILSSFMHSNNNTTFSFVDGSVGATSWFWDFGDGNTSTQQNPTHTYANMNPYTVSLSINGGSCVSTQVINDLTSINNSQIVVPQIALIPNPSSGLTTIRLNKAHLEDLTIQIFGTSGRIIQTAILAAGTTEFTLNLEELPKALYLIKIHGANFSETRKLILK